MAPNPDEREPKVRKRVKPPGVHSEAGIKELALFFFICRLFFLCLNSTSHPFDFKPFPGEPIAIPKRGGLEHDSERLKPEEYRLKLLRHCSDPVLFGRHSGLPYEQGRSPCRPELKNIFI
jgi:hypothetical protein